MREANRELEAVLEGRRSACARNSQPVETIVQSDLHKILRQKFTSLGSRFPFFQSQKHILAVRPLRVHLNNCIVAAPMFGTYPLFPYPNTPSKMQCKCNLDVSLETENIPSPTLVYA